MQKLLSEAVMLPSLLQQADSLFLLGQQIQAPEIGRVIKLFGAFHSQLVNREVILAAEGQQPYGLRGMSPYEAGEIGNTRASSQRLCYSSVTMANIFTHLWAFQIVCLTEIQRIITAFPCVDLSRFIPPDLSFGDSTQSEEHIASLAVQVSRSMDYLLQDEMELFGPASTFFPLRVAYEYFKKHDSKRMDDIVFIEVIVQRLEQKGFLCARALVMNV